MVDTLSESLDIFHRLLFISKSTQISIVDILCCICIDNDRQNQIVEKNFIPIIMRLFVENLVYDIDMNLVRLTNEYLVGICVKFFCSICYENANVAQRLLTIVSTDTNQTLCEIVSNLLSKINQPVISYYSSRFFVNLCKTKVLSCEDPNISHKSLTTLVHLCTTKSIHLYIPCFDTLIYLLNGNSSLHHITTYTEQFLSKLISYLLTTNKMFDGNTEETMIIEMRTLILTLLAVLSSTHEDIRERIAKQDGKNSNSI